MSHTLLAILLCSRRLVASKLSDNLDLLPTFVLHLQAAHARVEVFSKYHAQNHRLVEPHLILSVFVPSINQTTAREIP